MITYRPLPSVSGIHVVYSGVVTADDLIHYGDRLCEDPTLPRRLRILTDVTEATYRFERDDMPRLMENLERHLRVFERIRAAFLQARPRETAMSLLMEHRNPEPRYEHRVFSTEEAALAWLARPFGSDDEVPSPTSDGPEDDPLRDDG